MKKWLKISIICGSILAFCAAAIPTTIVLVDRFQNPPDNSRSLNSITLDDKANSNNLNKYIYETMNPNKPDETIKVLKVPKEFGVIQISTENTSLFDYILMPIGLKEQGFFSISISNSSNFKGIWWGDEGNLNPPAYVDYWSGYIINIKKCVNFGIDFKDDKMLKFPDVKYKCFTKLPYSEYQGPIEISVENSGFIKKIDLSNLVNGLKYVESFSNNVKLSNVELPTEGVLQSIVEYAFYNTKISSIIIPKTVWTMGSHIIGNGKVYDTPMDIRISFEKGSKFLEYHDTSSIESKAYTIINIASSYNPDISPPFHGVLDLTNCKNITLELEQKVKEILLNDKRFNSNKAFRIINFPSGDRWEYGK